MIHFACPSCKSGLKADNRSGGKLARCPRCKAPIEIPKSTDEPLPLDAFEESTSDSPAEAYMPRPTPLEYFQDPEWEEVQRQRKTSFLFLSLGITGLACVLLAFVVILARSKQVNPAHGASRQFGASDSSRQGSPPAITLPGDVQQWSVADLARYLRERGVSLRVDHIPTDLYGVQWQTTFILGSPDNFDLQERIETERAELFQLSTRVRKEWASEKNARYKQEKAAIDAQHIRGGRFYGEPGDHAQKVSALRGRMGQWTSPSKSRYEQADQRIDELDNQLKGFFQQRRRVVVNRFGSSEEARRKMFLCKEEWELERDAAVGTSRFSTWKQFFLAGDAEGIQQLLRALP